VPLPPGSAMVRAMAFTRRALIAAAAALPALPSPALPAMTVTPFAPTDDLARAFAPEGTAPAPDHAAWEALARDVFVAGADGIVRVRYGALKAQPGALDGYVEMLAALDPTALAPADGFAYWANLYNALTLQVIVGRYPVASIRDIPSGLFFPFGPWRRDVVTVNGRALSLDDIEHRILRGGWREPRIHHAVNCASIGCPNLPLTAWRGDTLDRDLDAAARAFVNHPRGCRIEGGRLIVSSIYHWYAEDFGGSDAGVIAHLRRYAAPELADVLSQRTTIDDHAYDWGLNDAG